MVAPQLKQGQTLLFLGDHTSPDDQGYVGIIRDVLTRFHANLQTRLISAGSPKQTAAALGSQALTDLITSSRPEWLIIGIGLADALREPDAVIELNSQKSLPSKSDQADADAIFGPEFRARRESLGPVSDVGRDPEPKLEHLARFERELSGALAKISAAGINIAVLTTVLVGANPHATINKILRAYNKAIRTAASQSGALLIDIEKACKDVMDRALNYKQSVELASMAGKANAQGQALVARTVQEALGILPQPGWRPFR